MADVDEPTEADKLPVTIVTGFLGAGKTTLVNHILQGKHGMRIAIIENEFGAVSIDDDLVSENLKAAESIVSMDNGCVCCTVRGDLVRALVQLAEKKDKFDAIIIETTGLADPAPVAFTFFINPEVNEHYKIDSILCLADAKHIGEHLAEEKAENAVNEAVQQVAFADRILLNKTDLVSPEQLREVRETLNSINSFAEVIPTQQSKVDLKKILGVNSFSLEKTLEVDPEFLHEEQDADDHHGHAHDADGKCMDKDDHHGHSHDKDGHCEKEEHGHEHGHGHGHKEKEHGHGHGHGHGHTEEPRKKKSKKMVHDLSGVGSVGITLEGELDDVAFNTFMQKLLKEKARDIYRSKGVLAIAGQDSTKFVFQGVHEQINFGPCASTWKEGEKKINKLVFIGRNLKREELEAGFKDTVFVPPPPGWKTTKDDYGRRYYYHEETNKTQW
eukprot:CAMPEP_0197854068 /NCGR_PEP_ID=MMETSP1438-20131217/23982_1 /TAXON_ID=1461541 /ORGANISM="Pterosperma sp., Strain CCMP1384" /LENGTH=442 /DNA_ID=CAMNT_0043468703 /DNA_START=108 /DNA_END=1433 /DNA_ORIENTATION=+